MFRGESTAVVSHLRGEPSRCPAEPRARQRAISERSGQRRPGRRGSGGMRQAAGGSAAAPTGERHRNEPGRFGTALPALEAGQMSPHERLGKKEWPPRRRIRRKEPRSRKRETRKRKYYVCRWQGEGIEAVGSKQSLLPFARSRPKKKKKRKGGGGKKRKIKREGGKCKPPNL